MNFRVLNDWWMSKVCSIGFVVLIVLPTTAPFQAFDLSEIFGHRHSGESLTPASRDSLVPFYRETRVTTLPAPDRTEDRLDVGSRSVADVQPSIPARRPVRRSWRPPADPSIQPSPTVLRL